MSRVFATVKGQLFIGAILFGLTINSYGLSIVTDELCSLEDGYALPKEITIVRKPCHTDDLVTVEKNNKWGFIDTKGNTVIPYKYDDADIFSEGLAAVSISGKYGFIDNLGKEIIPMQYQYASFFSEGLAWIVMDDKFGFINKQGEVIISILYDAVLGGFEDGKVSVLKNDKWLVIDKTGYVLESE